MAIPLFNTPPYHGNPQLGTSRLRSKYLIPVVNQLAGGSGIGRMLAKANLPVYQGRIKLTILGFSDRGDFLVLSNGQSVLAEHIVVLQTDAAANGYPGTNDVQQPTHVRSAYLFP